MILHIKHEITLDSRLTSPNTKIEIVKSDEPIPNSVQKQNKASENVALKIWIQSIYQGPCFGEHSLSLLCQLPACGRSLETPRHRVSVAHRRDALTRPLGHGRAQPHGLWLWPLDSPCLQQPGWGCLNAIDCAYIIMLLSCNAYLAPHNDECAIFSK